MAKKKNNDLISVIIPAYKVEKYFARCIDSVTSQTYTNLEIILVDDGSPDECGSIADQYAKKDKRIKVIHQENQGLSGARNAGINICKGKYITFIDSDDVIAKDYVEYLYQLLKKNDAQISICNYHIFTKNHPESLKEKENIQVLTSKEVLEQMLYTEVYFISAWGKLYHRDLFSSVLYPKGKIYEDMATTYKLVNQCERIACGSLKKYFYFMRSDSYTKQKFSPLQFDMISNTLKMTKDINSWYPDLKEGCIVRNVHAYFSTYCRMINSEDSYENEKKEILQYIKKFRKNVLKSKKASHMDKMTCLLISLGEDVFKKIWNGYWNHKYGLKG